MTRLVVRVLLFQTVRMVVNGLRRAFDHPVRAALTLLVVGFFLCGWGTALLGSIYGAPPPRTPQGGLQPEQIFARSVGVIVLIHWLYVVLTVVPSVFRPAQILVLESDVHYLFTTPLKPLTLFRGLILLRGTLGALFFLAMLAFYLVMFGGANLRMMALAQPLAVGAWTILIYPLLYLLVFASALLGSVALEAAEIAGRGYRQRLAWGLILWVALGVLAVGGKVWQLRLTESGQGFLTLLGQAVEWVPAYVLLLPVRGLADAALVLYNGFTPALWFGLVFWMATALLGNAALVRYQDRLYEVGASLARKGAQARAAQRDPFRVYIERKAEQAARKPLRTLRWLERWTPRGVWALLWRDLLITWRASGWGNLVMIVLMAVLPVGIMLLVHLNANPERNLTVALRMVYVLVQSLIVFFVAFGAYYSMTDMLRRVEWQKPLPFSPRAVVIIEALPTVVLFTLSQLCTVILASLLFPSDWLFWVGASLVAISWCAVLQMAMMWIALVNPDPSDYTQRLLTGVLMVPALLLSGAPGLGLWVLGVGLQWNLLLTAGLAFAANMFVGTALAAVNSVLYERFSPIE